jgi:sucrose-6-phosphate hydrolase SacC (GH32 family)
MSLPLELKLLATPEGPRLSMWPVKELEVLHGKGQDVKAPRPGETSTFQSTPDQPLRVEAVFEPGPDSVVEMTINGVPVTFDAAKQELTVNGHRAPAPLRRGRQQLLIYTDRTAFEVFGSDGLTYMPCPVIAKAEAKGGSVTVRGGAVKFEQLTVTPLKSIWK